MADIALVLQLEIEAGRVARFKDGRWRKRNDKGAPYFLKSCIGPSCQGKYRISVPCSFAPVHKAHKSQTRALTATAEAVAVNSEHVADNVALLLQEIISHLI